MPMISSTSGNAIRNPSGIIRNKRERADHPGQWSRDVDRPRGRWAAHGVLVGLAASSFVQTSSTIRTGTALNRLTYPPDSTAARKVTPISSPKGRGRSLVVGCQSSTVGRERRKRCCPLLARPHATNDTDGRFRPKPPRAGRQSYDAPRPAANARASLATPPQARHARSGGAAACDPAFRERGTGGMKRATVATTDTRRRRIADGREPPLFQRDRRAAGPGVGRRRRSGGRPQRDARRGGGIGVVVDRAEVEPLGRVVVVALAPGAGVVAGVPGTRFSCPRWTTSIAASRSAVRGSPPSSPAMMPEDAEHRQYADLPRRTHEQQGAIAAVNPCW